MTDAADLVPEVQAPYAVGFKTYIPLAEKPLLGLSLCSLLSALCSLLSLLSALCSLLSALCSPLSALSSTVCSSSFCVLLYSLSCVVCSLTSAVSPVLPPYPICPLAENMYAPLYAFRSLLSVLTAFSVFSFFRKYLCVLLYRHSCAPSKQPQEPCVKQASQVRNLNHPTIALLLNHACALSNDAATSSHTPHTTD
jgi:hypothetical protein